MPTPIGAIAAIGLMSAGAALIWKRRQARAWFATGGLLPPPATAAQKTAGQQTATRWQPTYTAPDFPTEAIHPTRAGTAAFVVPEGRFVRGLNMNRVTQAGVVTPHWGIDIAAPIGMPVYAAKSGTVSRVGPINGYGNTVIVSHNDGQSTLYAHLNRIVARQGMQVHGGQLIGEVGRTSAGPSGVPPTWGATMGAHLHMEVHRTPEPILTRMNRRLDPVAWLQQNNIAQYQHRWARS